MTFRRKEILTRISWVLLFLYRKIAELVIITDAITRIIMGKVDQKFTNIGGSVMFRYFTPITVRTYVPCTSFTNLAIGKEKSRAQAMTEAVR
jgi:hypothetical protein